MLINLKVISISAPQMSIKIHSGFRKLKRTKSKLVIFKRISSPVPNALKIFRNDDFAIFNPYNVLKISKSLLHSLFYC